MAKSRPRTNTERGRASRLRAARARGRRLSKRDAAWLRRYEGSVQRHGMRGRSRSARVDAIAIVVSLLDWGQSGEPEDIEARWVRMPRPGRPGYAEARVDVDVLIVPSAQDQLDSEEEDEEQSAFKKMTKRPPRFPKSTGRGANIRARLDMAEDSPPGDTADGRDRWISLGALSADWKELASSVAKKVAELQERYEEKSITAWSVYVTGHRYT